MGEACLTPETSKVYVRWGPFSGLDVARLEKRERWATQEDPPMKPHEQKAEILNRG